MRLEVERLGLEGCFLVSSLRSDDNRGFFETIFESDSAGPLRLDALSQVARSANTKAGTVRGLHFQHEPYAEAKFVCCLKGKVFDVAVDLRPSSSTRGRWISVELSDSNGKGLFIPQGYAHGFQTLEDETELLYLISEPYRKESASGIRWNDPHLSITWPLEVSEISDRDRSFPDYDFSSNG